MPKTRAVLDSSPVTVASPRKRPIKRSASTASLPTPPRTHHKRKHSKLSEPETDSDSGSERQLDTDDNAISFGNKKRRTSTRANNKTADEEEREFWVESIADRPNAEERSQSQNQFQTATRSPSTSPSVSPVDLFYRTAPIAPVSPPPSRRQTVLRTGRPATPKQSANASSVDDTSGPIRDSPNNPFLADSPRLLNDASPAEPRTPSPSDHAEKPTITYVFRGIKAEFDNPLYHLSPSAHARAALPVDHPEYSPTAACPPRLLFPEAHKARNHRTRTTRAQQSRDSESSPDLPQRPKFQKESDLFQRVERVDGP